MAARPPLSRRGLLTLLGASALLAGCGGANNSSPPSAELPGPDQRIRYADEHPDQYGVLGLPRDTPPKGVLVLLHGGFWLSEYGADLMEPMAADFRDRGFATWNVEYRRVGNGGGFPRTFEDVAAAVDHVQQLDEVAGLDVHLIGHSAGGHLAVWAASRTARTPGGAPRTVPTSTISLSGVLDLSSAASGGLGNGAAEALMAALPDDARSDYAVADPCALVPARGAVFAVHAQDDQIVPRDQSTTYVQLDGSAGGKAELVTVPGGHFDVIDPTSAAWKQIVQLLEGQ
ncbi:MAG: alpha/beta hydrolase [Propionibacteriales bacterium]|nr:alpha/beta hydrolase [Propionibacteriales bacterium]